ncbi:Protein-L-isoaspartate O-methyltransferase [Geodia barretti]|uniref:protein-L-isoaspartate(D-aspartate) O-methyltransferase n=1 Tax=Geodia barretti TaxID=519541 RepID=A0AA35S0J4_GEOBA|nr:Protein-L-isoaspartate O-methyltransferase [Geodia barretti]
MEQVPREQFVPPDAREMAYLNIPLPIGRGQTVSQPYIVARMTELLELRGNERALEVGTGSGYQTAILSLLLPRGHLYTVERDLRLFEATRARLEEQGYHNVTAEMATNALGAADYAPFDAIIVTAACPRLPDSLVAQLAVGGRLVAPVGPRNEQDLIVARRTDEGLSVSVMGKCRFVPLLGPEGFGEN